MDLGFLSGLFGGQGKNGNDMLTTLLPLLLGGKSTTSDGANPTEMLTRLLKGNSRGNDGSFPPLFSDQNGANRSIDPNIMSLLGNVTKPVVSEVKREETQSGYPYELQYNRPDR